MGWDQGRLAAGLPLTVLQSEPNARRHRPICQDARWERSESAQEGAPASKHQADAADAGVSPRMGLEGRVDPWTVLRLT